MDQNSLLDPNLYKVIDKCYLRKKNPSAVEIHVVYTDGIKEVIWTFDPNRFEFNHHEFIGKSKIAAVFYCDRKEPKYFQLT